MSLAIRRRGGEGGREKVSIKCVFFCFPKLTTTTNVSQALRAVPSKVPADNE